MKEKFKAAAVIPVVLCILSIHGGSYQSGTARPVSGEIKAETSELVSLIERFSADRRSLERHYDIAFSPERLDRFEAFLRERLGLLDGVDFDDLSLDGRIDYLLFKNLLHRELGALQKERQGVRDALPLLPYAENILALARDLKRMNWIDGRNAAAELNAIGIEAVQAERALASGSPPGKTAMRQALSMAR